ncbi:MAG TPA: hypothetical protein VJN18_04000 [Polyangiaceae bacterium]|nr:hypothetical protein [Polyangiaceae bacterium]
MAFNAYIMSTMTAKLVANDLHVTPVQAESESAFSRAELHQPLAMGRRQRRLAPLR